MLRFPGLTAIWLIFSVGGIWLLYRLVVRFWRGNLRRVEGVKGVGPTGGIIRLLAGLLLLFIAASAFWLEMTLRAYKTLTKEELAAIVRCVEDPPGSQTLKLILEEVEDGRRSKPIELTLKGDQWAVEANILKWEGWVNLLGLHTCYKLTRVCGRYERAEDEVSKERTVYQLREEDPLWRWLYRRGEKLPFVEAVYGSSAFQYPDPGSAFGVYVAISGLMIKRLEDAP
ncbi:hypothetical protein DRP77_08565 [Candidatus Poribacteria bacterium]|nr:MAG: hypothetical protein DRP77_08565 [Candidatus Poribacteria bacterium]